MHMQHAGLHRLAAVLCEHPMGTCVGIIGTTDLAERCRRRILTAALTQVRSCRLPRIFIGSLLGRSQRNRLDGKRDGKCVRAVGTVDVANDDVGYVNLPVAERRSTVRIRAQAT